MNQANAHSDIRSKHTPPILRHALQLLGCVLLCLTSHNAFSVVAIPNQLEFRTFTDIETTYGTAKTYESTYINPVIVCTYNLADRSHRAAQVRIRNINSSGFEIRLQSPNSGTSPTSKTVYCIISETGTFTNPIPYVAGSITSEHTQKKSDWSAPSHNIASNISITGLTNTNLTVLGQVTTESTYSATSLHSNFVSFWSNDCNTRSVIPTTNNLCVSKMSGHTTTSGADETLSYIVSKADTYTLPNVGSVQIKTGSRSITGATNNSQISYSLDTSNPSYTFATATMAGASGSDGGWAAFYGINPLDSQQMVLVIDETISPIRSHTTENVAFWAFSPNPTPSLKLQKTVATQSDPVNGKASNAKTIPGSVLDYTISVINENESAPDTDTIVITDNISNSLQLYVGTSDTDQIITLIDGVAPHQSDFDTFNYLGPNSTTDHVDFSAFASGNDWTHTPTDSDGDGYEDSSTTRRVRFRLPGRIKLAVPVTDNPGNYTTQPVGNIRFSAKYTPN